MIIKGTDSRIFPSWSTSESPQNKGLKDKQEEDMFSVNTLSAEQTMRVTTFVNHRRFVPALVTVHHRFTFDDCRTIY